MMLKRKKITIQKALRLGKQSVCLQMCPLLNWLVNSQCGVSRGTQNKMSVTLFQKQQLDPCITQSKWKRFFCQGFSKRETKTALYSDFNRGPPMFVYETCSFASLVSFPQPFLDRKLCWIYFDYSNLYLLTDHVFSTVNLNINGNKKCGEASRSLLRSIREHLKG